MKVSSAKKQLKIVVVGRSGAGKSTFINMIANLIKGKKYEDERIVAISQGLSFKAKEGEDDVKITFQCNVPEFMHLQSDNLSAGQHESQTQRCNMYTFSSEDFDLMLIDTPGLGDTRGVDQDKLNVVMIAEQVARLSTFNAIILLHKASDVRADISVGYLINELRAMMPKSCQDNIIVAFSHVVNPLKVDARDSLHSLGLNLDKQIYFECDCLIHPMFIKSCFPNDRRFNLHMKKSSMLWDMNRESFNDMISMLNEMVPIDANSVEALRQKKLLLTDKVNNAIDQIRTIVGKKVEMATKVEELRACKMRIFKEKDVETVISHEVIPGIKIVEEQVQLWYPCEGKWVIQCKVCNKVCEKHKHVKQHSWVGSSKRNMEDYLRKWSEYACNNEEKGCPHAMSDHQLFEETYYRLTTKTKYLQADEIKDVKEINLTAQSRLNDLETTRINIENDLEEAKHMLKCLEDEILNTLETIASDLKTIEEGSLAEVNDCCLVRLTSDINKAQEREQHGSLTASLEIQYLKKIMDQYTELKKVLAKNDSSNMNIEIGNISKNHASPSISPVMAENSNMPIPSKTTTDPGLGLALNQPTTTSQTSVQPLTTGQTAVQPSATSQTSVQPLTTGQTAVQPSATSQTSVQPLTTGQTAVQPSATSQTSVQPLTTGQTAVQQPLTTGQTAVQPSATSQTSVQPLTTGQTAVQPVRADRGILTPSPPPHPANHIERTALLDQSKYASPALHTETTIPSPPPPVNPFPPQTASIPVANGAPPVPRGVVKGASRADRLKSLMRRKGEQLNTLAEEERAAARDSSFERAQEILRIRKKNAEAAGLLGKNTQGMAANTPPAVNLGTAQQTRNTGQTYSSSYTGQSHSQLVSTELSNLNSNWSTQGRSSNLL
jgi:GTPase SAR1 family protein